MTGSRAARWTVLGAILLPFLFLKIETAPGDGPYGLDASYYFQIARHVAEGEGLTTSVSLYHEGLNPLPAPARIYPLWPLLLGASGRLLGLRTAANVLPPLLYFISLIMLYAVSRRLVVAMSNRGADRPIDPGHLVVAAFAANPMFWSATSHPYTEGLAFALALGALLALDASMRRDRAAFGFAAGALAGLAFLARSQMLVVVVAILMVLGVAAIRRIGRRALAGALGGVLAAVLPWAIVRALHPPRVTDVGAFAVWSGAASVGAYLADRAPGLLVAFDPRSPLSYFRSFGVTVVLLPLALAWAVAARARGGRDARWEFEPRHALASALLAAALLNHAVLVHRHARFFLPWLFGWRHGLPLVFAVAVATVYLMTRRSPPVRWAAAALVVIAAATGALRIYASRDDHPAPTAAESGFARWVNAQSPPPTLLTRRAQTLGMLTRGRYHWTDCGEPPEQTRLMLDRLPIDYVVVYDSDRPCRFLSGLGGVLRVADVFGSPPEERIWVLRRVEARPAR